MDSETTAIIKETATMLTIGEVARLLHAHKNTIRRWSDRGIIQAYRIGPRGDRRFSEDDIARFLSQFKYAQTIQAKLL